jgi:hypothetical protein
VDLIRASLASFAVEPHRRFEGVGLRMLWTLESVGLLAAGALTVNLVVGSVVYAASVLIRFPRTSLRSEST